MNFLKLCKLFFLIQLSTANHKLFPTINLNGQPSDCLSENCTGIKNASSYKISDATSTELHEIGHIPLEIPNIPSIKSDYIQYFGQQIPVIDGESDSNEYRMHAPLFSNQFLASKEIPGIPENGNGIQTIINGNNNKKKTNILPGGDIQTLSGNKTENLNVVIGLVNSTLNNTSKSDNSMSTENASNNNQSAENSSGQSVLLGLPPSILSNIVEQNLFSGSVDKSSSSKSVENNNNNNNNNQNVNAFTKNNGSNLNVIVGYSKSKLNNAAETIMAANPLPIQPSGKLSSESNSVLNFLESAIRISTVIPEIQSMNTLTDKTHKRKSQKNLSFEYDGSPNLNPPIVPKNYYDYSNDY